MIERRHRHSVDFFNDERLSHRLARSAVVFLGATCIPWERQRSKLRDHCFDRDDLYMIFNLPDLEMNQKNVKWRKDSDKNLPCHNWWMEIPLIYILPGPRILGSAPIRHLPTTSYTLRYLVRCIFEDPQKPSKPESAFNSGDRTQHHFQKLACHRYKPQVAGPISFIYRMVNSLALNSLLTVTQVIWRGSFILMWSPLLLSYLDWTHRWLSKLLIKL